MGGETKKNVMVGYVARRGSYRDLVGDLMERDHLEDLDIDWRKILKWIFKKWDGGSWTGLILGQGQVAGCCEYDN